MRQKLKLLLEQYGRIAIVTYFAIFALTLAGFAIAISYGMKVESAGGGAGLLVASWVATKLTQPLRIAGTLALTPLVAAVLKKVRPDRGELNPSSAGSSPPPVGPANDG